MAYDQWRQGDVILDHPDGPLVIVSRTCDIVRPPTERPVVHCAALVRDVGIQARRWRRPRYAPLPSYDDGNWFSDFDTITAIGKESLNGCARERGVTGESKQRRFRRQVGRYFSKPSHEIFVEETIRPIVERFGDKHTKQSAEGRLIEQIVDVRVRLSWTDSGTALLDIYFIVEPSAYLLDPEEMWQVSTEIRDLMASGGLEGLNEIAKAWDESGTAHDRAWLLGRYLEVVTGPCVENPAGPIGEVAWHLEREDEFPYSLVKETSPADVEQLSYAGDGPPAP